MAKVDLSEAIHIKQGEENPTYTTCSRNGSSSRGTVSCGRIFLWGSILGVSLSLLPFLCIPSSPSPPSPSTTGQSAWAGIWRAPGVRVGGLVFPGTSGRKRIQSTLGAELGPSGCGQSTFPHCSLAYLEGGVDLPESHGLR